MIGALVEQLRDRGVHVELVDGQVHYLSERRPLPEEARQILDLRRREVLYILIADSVRQTGPEHQPGRDA